MLNGYADDKKPEQVPTMALIDFENEVKRILSTEQSKIDELKKQVEDLNTVIASKRHRITSLDQEFADALAKKQAEAAALVSEAKARLNDTQATNDAAHALYDAALKDAHQAQADAKSAKELKNTLETELAVTRSKQRDLDYLIEKAKEKNLLIDSQVFELGQREAAAQARINALDKRSAELDGKAAGLSARREALDVQEASLGSLIAQSQTARKEAEDAIDSLHVTKGERAKFEAEKAAVAAKVAGFIETENSQLARENRIKLDVKALQEGMADLDRRRKNIEQREAALAQKI